LPVTKASVSPIGCCAINFRWSLASARRQSVSKRVSQATSAIDGFDFETSARLS